MSARVCVVGPPNAGKSTLFNALTGRTVATGNFPGTTVTVQRGEAVLGGAAVELIDLPGTYSLAAQSDDERVTLDALIATLHAPGDGVVLFIGDAPRLSRTLYLLLQVLDLNLPVVVALNLMDEARAAGAAPDAHALSERLGVPVVPIVARTGEGLGSLRAAIGQALSDPASARPGPLHPWPTALDHDLRVLLPHLPAPWRGPDPVRALGLAAWAWLSAADAPSCPAELREAVRQHHQAALASGRDPQLELIGARYQWIDALIQALPHLASEPPRRTPDQLTDRVDRFLLHPLTGGLTFLVVMQLVFFALFTWSDPAIGLIESGFEQLSGLVVSAFERAGATSPAATLLRDFLVDGLIGGVGGVVVFVPQIAVLFFLLGLLDNSGYLARAAHMTDRVLRTAGLPGRAFVPLLSGFACAVPAILATRTMPRWRDRLLTMLVLPLTTCSARLPVYTLMIATLFPALVPGTSFPLQPLALMAMYLFGAATTVAAALVLGTTLLPASSAAEVLELPPYRTPHLPSVLQTVKLRTVHFLREAGGIILVATIALWVLLSFPRYSPEQVLPPEVLTEAVARGDDLDALAAPYAVERSFAARLGKLVEPAIAPLGFDWKIGVGVIGAFAAREVFVSTMGVVYGIADADETSGGLREAMLNDRHPDGRPVFTPLVGASLMVFFSLAMQCTSTLAVMRKETGSWRWPLLQLATMTALAWTGSFLVYQVGMALGWG
jgi:ferrous iron transport protein B